MTTIVYDHASQKIAVDGRTTSSGVVTSDCERKFIETADGIWFLSGCLSDFDLLIESFKDGDKAFDLPAIPDALALFVRDGDVFIRAVTDKGEAWTQKLNHNRCIGSGSSFATAALDFGKNAVEAVQYAATRDIYTGGRIAVYDIVSQLFEFVE